MRFSFWYTWLLVASVFFAGFGLLVAVAPDNVMLTWWNKAVAQHFFDGTVSPRAHALGSFLLGPLGATISGFYVLQIFIVRNAFRRRERWAWWAIALATLVWFVVDSIRSLQHGATFNVWMINLPALSVIALPLVMTWSDVHRSAEDVLQTS